MNESYKLNLYVALIHYPVVNKKGDIIASAFTNLDMHDISRIAKTYGVPVVYMVTPLADQKALMQKIIAHWKTGAGAAYNPNRREALEVIRIKDSLDQVIGEVHQIEGDRPKTVATCAKKYPQNIGYQSLQKKLKTLRPYLLILGTAWGLAEEIITGSDYVLEPIRGCGNYNHLSVRSATAIILDRLYRT